MGPTEAYGFSNGARATFGPPTWEDTRFHFAGDEETIRIEMH